MNNLMRPLALALGSALAAYATPCGTVASPTACSVTVGAGTTTTFTASNFQLLNSVNPGGGNLYQAADIAIDIASGGGRSALLTFSKNSSGPTPGSAFIANAGDESDFLFTYTLSIIPDGPGSVDFTNLSVSLSQSSFSNGVSSFQSIVSPTSCQVVSGFPFESCPLTGQPDTVSVGNFVSLAGNLGNTSIGTFSSLFDTSFTAGTAPTPEPSTFALVGIGLAALRFLRR